MTALHGFLGRPEDWDGVLGDEWTKPDWLALLQEKARGSFCDRFGPGLSFEPQRHRDTERGFSSLMGSFPDHGRIPETSLCASVPLWFKNDPKSQTSYGLLEALAEALNRQSPGDTLLGYSMGGRIALHMLIQEPERWRRAVIVSASPGLTSETERAARLAGDARWAGRFESESWDDVVRDWNAQAVFAQDPPDRLPRREADFDRHALADALVFGSVARQRDLRPELRTLDVPILWIAGARDPKYAALAEACAALNPLFAAAILDAGHRVPWGATGPFRAAVEEFITITP